MAQTKKVTSKATSKKTVKTTKPKTAPRSKKVVVPSGWTPTVLITRLYALGGFLILMLSTLLWSALSARLHQGNADQLVNSYLFENANTFQKALLPGQHTFLLKWPVFWLIHLMDASGAAFVGTTIVISLLTVGLLAALLYRIDKRPLVFGTLCVALASVLIMIPAQPYSGGLLPVNLAMIATRNLEYILYIVCLILVIRWHEVRSWGFWLAVSGLGLLIASDKIFLIFSVGGAIVAAMSYGFMRRWKMAQLSIKWFLAAVFAAILAFVIVWGIGATGLTHISTQATTTYTVIHGMTGLLKAFFYAVLGLTTNFGANPVFDGLMVRQLPHLAMTRLFGVGGLSFVVNFGIMAAGFWAAGSLLVRSMQFQPRRQLELNTATRLSLLLTWTSLIGFMAFIVTDHYYAVDARYLTIFLFAVFVALATYARQREWPARRLMIVGGIIALTSALGMTFSLKTYHSQAAVLKPNNDHNSLVAQAMAHHKSNILVGDYWRVVPIKEAAKKGNNLNIMPLSSCLEARDVLSSKAWQPDLHHTSFAYLLSLQHGLTDYPNCSLEQVIGAYGRPNASAVVAGSVEHPSEVLLFYDGGIRQSAPAVITKIPSTVLPISLGELPNTSCVGPTIMNVVAHEDDDLLFMNPDLLHDIHQGHCIRTVYVTAGDAGSDEFYWLSREQGSEAAYAKMTGDNSIWVQRVVKVDDKQFITVANPRGNNKISLIFMRLPDGNLKGQGFAHSNYQSLEHLYNGSIPAVQSATKQSSFTSGQLVDALAAIMHTYQPSQIRTQANVASGSYTDHSDHIAVGKFTQRAYRQYEDRQFEGKVTIPMSLYVGYPVREHPQNVFGQDLQDSEDLFLAYARFDGAVCQSVQQCTHGSTIEAYLQRQYKLPE
jgi:LmbE family N-acetylglucosaminyl deacetylase